MQDQRHFWENSILQWEKFSYAKINNDKIPLVEKIANYFRHPVRFRRVIAFEILQTEKPMRVLDLGCGSGSFAIDLVTKAGIGHVTGVDISGPAIQEAQNNTTLLKLNHQLEFVRSSVLELKPDMLASFDMVVGLGLIQYLTDEEFNHLFSSIRQGKFWFEIHPEKIDFINMAHSIYRKIKGHPFYKLYSQKELFDKLGRLGISKLTWKENQGVYYIQNF